MNGRLLAKLRADAPLSPLREPARRAPSSPTRQFPAETRPFRVSIMLAPLGVRAKPADVAQAALHVGAPK